MWMAGRFRKRKKCERTLEEFKRKSKMNYEKLKKRKGKVPHTPPTKRKDEN